MWPTGRQRDGGVDCVPTPDGYGQLWLCGKHVVGPDPDAARARIAPGATIVCLNEPGDIARYPNYQEWLASSPDALWFPMPDFHAPPVAEMRPFVEDLALRLRRGEDLIVHCSAGMGRTGTTAMCILLELGVPADEVLGVVRAARPGAGPQAGPQADLVRDYAAGF